MYCTMPLATNFELVLQILTSILSYLVSDLTRTLLLSNNFQYSHSPYLQVGSRNTQALEKAVLRFKVARILSGFNLKTCSN